MDEPIQLPIDGVLDLHTFRPQDAKVVLLEYLIECRRRGILEVRVIHGKGIGHLRQTVHAILGRHPDVATFAEASAHFGGWGATIVHLRPAAQTGWPPAAKPGKTRRQPSIKRPAASERSGVKTYDVPLVSNGDFLVHAFFAKTHYSNHLTRPAADKR